MKTEEKLRSIGDQLKFSLALAGIEISIIDLEGRWFSWDEFSDKNFGHISTGFAHLAIVVVVHGIFEQRRKTSQILGAGGTVVNQFIA